MTGIKRNIVAQFMSMLLVCSIVYAQGSAASSPKRVVVRAGHMLDVRTGKMLTDQAVVIEGDKIVSTGPAASSQVAGATW